MSPRVSRRELLCLAGAAGAGLAAGAAGGELLVDQERGDALSEAPSDPVSFYGTHQAGITTPQPGHLCFASFDVSAVRVEDLRGLLALWTESAARMTAGSILTPADRPGIASDSGETVGLPPSRLALSFGLGPQLFRAGRTDAAGLAAQRPSALVELPSFRGDQLDPRRTSGDLSVQACADDPQVAFHAVRYLAGLARGTATIRWMQRGFRSPPGQSATDGPRRNLLGFRDGTNNLDPADEQQMSANVWVGTEEEPAWMRGGTYMVVRRIRMRIEHWDSVSLVEQERTFGRRKVSGAPFGGKMESDPVDPAKLPPDCHVIQAQPRTPGSEAERILRRSYSFSDGFDARFGELDAGLFFVCFQRDPRKQFIPIQTRLAEHDHLTEYVFHTGSAIFAMPPGVGEGQYIGQTLLEAV